MTADPALEKLHAAVQEYVREVEDPDYIVTDFALAYAAIDLHTAAEKNFIGYSVYGPIHATLGLATLLAANLTTDLTGDDE